MNDLTDTRLEKRLNMQTMTNMMPQEIFLPFQVGHCHAKRPPPPPGTHASLRSSSICTELTGALLPWK